jgi:hypothetical protein
MPMFYRNNIDIIDSKLIAVDHYFSGSLILSSIFQWSHTETMVFAVIAPDAAVAGTPIEGNV